MAQNNDFKVFQGNYIPADGAPVVLIFACSDKGKLYSEYFIFVQDSEREFYRESMSCKKEVEFPTAGIKLDINFMMNYALESAKAKLNDHLYQKYRSTKERAYLCYEYRLVEDSSALVRLYMRNQYSDQLEMILKDKRHYHKLFEFISELISLPKDILEIRTYSKIDSVMQ